MPRFVVLKHDCDEPHWDFMLEAGTILRTWKLVAQPEMEKEMEAKASFDHRLLYLDYEGPISDNRGSVTRLDFGSFDYLKQEEKLIMIRLIGKTLKGIVDLTNIGDGSWRFKISSALSL